MDEKQAAKQAAIGKMIQRFEAPRVKGWRKSELADLREQAEQMWRAAGLGEPPTEDKTLSEWGRLLSS